MTPPRWLFWHRRDLRLGDNLGLAAAAAATPALTGVYVLDPQILDADTMAPARRWFLIESLRELAERWRQAGSRLLLLRGDPLTLLPALSRAMGAEVVAWNRDVEPLARERDRRVAAALQAQACRVLADWDQLLVDPSAIHTGSGDPYRVYGPFWRNWRDQVERKAALGSAAAGGLDPLPAPGGLIDLNPAALADPQGWAQLPFTPAAGLATAIPHGFEAEAECPCRPGEGAALEQLQNFCSGQAANIPLLSYEPERNFPAQPGTSALGAALALGTLSPRQAWAAAQEARQLAGGEESLQAIRVWEQELAWREFYQQALFHFPELADGPYRPLWRQFPWENNPVNFRAWRDGLTGIPIVDAAMRQLNTSGWMHNRCRMIVASFLVKDLICDWRWGERAFMQRLVDGDLAANNGGWQWSASSGMDPKPLRIFNPSTQAKKFDPQAEYIRHWLPELARVSSADLISGAIAPLERRGYPAPIVDHRQQQARFKALYASLKPA